MQAQRWERISEIFDTLITLDPAERDAYLQRACANDAEMQSELISLLRAHDTHTGPLDSPPPFAANDTLEPQSSDEGVQVGPYRLLRLLGEGGMGTVWLAERIDGVLKRRVALKRPHVTWVGTLAERMVRERDILASLEHPGIARLYDAGIAADGRPFLALEYIEGLPVTRYCDSKQLDVRARLGIFLQILDAIRYAHSHLVIHRDIKPSNILVSEDGRVHLLDFGIARLLQDGAATAHTEFAPAATPDYASPEQISGTAVSTASDVYSLGVLLCELLSGARPYVLSRNSRGALEEAILEAEVRAPSSLVTDAAAAARGTFRPALERQLRSDLDNIVKKALRKVPAERYVTADLFARDVQAYLSGDPVIAHGDSASYRTRKFLQRNRIAAATTAIVFVALVTGASIALWQAREARAQAARAEEVQRFTLSLLQSADTDSGAGNKTTAVDLLRSAQKRVERELATRPAIAAELMTAIADGLIGQGESAEATPLLEKAIALSKQTFGPRHAQTLHAQISYGEALHNQSRNTEAVTLLRECVSNAAAIGNRHLQVNALRWLSSSLLDEGELDEGVAAAQAAVAALPVAQPNDRVALQDSFEVHLSLANALSNAQRPGVVEAAQTAIGFHDALAELGDAPSGIEARVLIGQALVREGRTTQGLEQLRAAYQESRELLGDAHIQTATIANLLGVSSLEGGDVTGAVSAFQASFDSVELNREENGVFAQAMGHYGLGAALVAAHRDQDALPHLESAQRLFAEANGPSAPLSLRARSMHAFSLGRLGRLSDAHLEFAALDKAEWPAMDKAAHLGRLAFLRSMQGKHTEAIELARLSVEGLSAHPSKSARALSLARLGSVLFAAGKTHEAVEPLVQSIELFKQAQPQPSPDYADALDLLERAEKNEETVQRSAG